MKVSVLVIPGIISLYKYCAVHLLSVQPKMATNPESLEERRRKFAKELWDLLSFPDVEVRRHTYPNGDKEDIIFMGWQYARWFFSLPVEELRYEFSPQEVYDLQSMFRADGCSSLKGSMYAYWQMATPDVQQIVPVSTKQAAFYGLGLDVYLNYIMKRSFIGLFAEIESYTEPRWQQYLARVGSDPEGPENYTCTVQQRAHFGADRNADPLKLLAQLPRSNYRSLMEGRTLHTALQHAKTPKDIAETMGFAVDTIKTGEVEGNFFVRDSVEPEAKRATQEDSASEESLEDEAPMEELLLNDG